MLEKSMVCLSGDMTSLRFYSDLIFDLFQKYADFCFFILLCHLCYSDILNDGITHNCILFILNLFFN